jgi:hypothetical protein
MKFGDVLLLLRLAAHRGAALDRRDLEAAARMLSRLSESNPHRSTWMR